MDDSDFSDDFCAFLQAAVPTIEAAEVLLLLFDDPERLWTPEEIEWSLVPGRRASAADARNYVQVFRSWRLLGGGASDERVRYDPASPELDRLVHKLASAYTERPVTLIRLIYRLRDEKTDSSPKPSG
jgi:hypothetical protein